MPFYQANPEGGLAGWKACSACKKSKPIATGFYRDKSKLTGHRYECKSCQDQAKDRWKSRNPNRHKEAVDRGWKRWSKAHPGRRRELARILDRKRRPAKRMWAKAYRKSNTSFRIANNLRRRIRQKMRGQRAFTSASQLLGCSFDNFRVYLESKF